MKLIENKLIADDGYLLKDKNDNGEYLEDGTYVPPYLTKVVYVGKQITTIEQCEELYEEVKEE